MSNLQRNYLSKDARQSSEAPARRLNVSPATIRRRLRKLLESGMLRIVAVVDPNKVGLNVIAIIAFDVAHDRLELAAHILAARPEVKWAKTTTGRFDILALARFRSTDEVSDFLQRELTGIEGLKDSEPFICLREYKTHYMQV